PMEVGPTCHYIMGGIRVEAETAASSLPGLFAAGECAAGLHGANRLGGNSLSDLLVFGRRAGLSAAAFAAKNAAPSINPAQIEEAERDMLAPFDRSDGENPYSVHRDLQEVMQNLVGIFRVEEDMTKAMGELEKLKQRATRLRVEGSRLFNPGWHLSRDLKSMLICSEAVARGALARKESRGAHSRIDFPKLDDQVWGKQHNVVTRDGSQMKLQQVPVGEIPAELKELVADEK
ncbi:MAG TPA: FAD-binding protein, partial [Verrucomicrobiae bacterium]|nr:FAD-binding protein [Verrucomicrobiae bacterium]